MTRGRKPLGPKWVDTFEASGGAKRRLRLILETVAGQTSIPEACEALGVTEARFHEIRQEAIGAALQELEPKPPGRPPKVISEADARVAELEAEVRELRIDLRAAQVREEIAAVMPHVLKPRKPALKKTAESPKAQELFAPRRSGGRSSGT